MGRKVVCLVGAACDIVSALQCSHLLLAHAHHAHHQCVQNLVVCTESRLGVSEEEERMTSAGFHAASTAFPVLLWEAEYGSATSALALVEWALAPHRVNLHTLQRLQPDIVITQIQKNGTLTAKKVGAALRDVLSKDVQIVDINPQCLDDVWKITRRVAEALDVCKKGQELVEDMKCRLAVVREMSMGRSKRRILVLKWIDPLLVGDDAWVSELIDLAGGIDVGTMNGISSRQLSWDIVRELAPEIIAFANYGWDLNKTDQVVSKMMKRGDLDPIVSSGGIFLATVDGSLLFSRPGPHLVESAEVLTEILHPECQPFGHFNRFWRQMELATQNK